MTFLSFLFSNSLRLKSKTCKYACSISTGTYIPFTSDVDASDLATEVFARKKNKILEYVTEDDRSRNMIDPSEMRDLSTRAHLKDDEVP